MEETNWIGKSGEKTSDSDNWDNGVPDYRKKAVFDVKERTEIRWDLKSLGISVEIKCDPEDVVIYISEDCMVGGSYFVPDAIREHFEDFKDDVLSLDVLDRPPPNPNDITQDEWRKLSDTGVVIPDYNNRCWNYNGQYYCDFFAFDEDNRPHFGTNYNWDGDGDNQSWDDVDNWGGGGYPDSNTDKATIPSGMNTTIDLHTSFTIGELVMVSGCNTTLQLSGNCSFDTAGLLSGAVTVAGGIFDANDKDVDIDGTITITATVVGGSGRFYIRGDWSNSGTFTKETSYVYFCGRSNQTITSGGSAFHHLGITNDTSVDLIISGNLDVDGNFYGDSQVGSLILNNGFIQPNVNTAGSVTFANGFSVTHGTGTWTFDGTTTYTDNNPFNIQDIGDISITGNPASLTLASDIQIGACIISSGDTFNAGGSYRIYVWGDWTNSGTFTKTTSDVLIECTSNVTITSGGDAFYNLQIVPDDRVDVTISGDLDIDGSFYGLSVVTTLKLNYGTPNPNINTAGNITFADGFQVTKGTGTWTFDGSSTYTDNNSLNAINIGTIVISCPVISTALTLASHIRVVHLTISSNTTFASGNQNIYVEGNWTRNGTFTYGSSHVHFEGTSTISNMYGNTHKFYDVTVKTGCSATISTKIAVSGTVTGCFTNDQRPSINTMTIEGDCTVDGTFHVSSSQTTDVCP